VGTLGKHPFVLYIMRTRLKFKAVQSESGLITRSSANSITRTRRRTDMSERIVKVYRRLRDPLLHHAGWMELESRPDTAAAEWQRSADTCDIRHVVALEPTATYGRCGIGMLVQNHRSGLRGADSCGCSDPARSAT
jgi:hypothetical protein